ncbi:MAG: ATP-binding protein [Chromatiales bacterium]|jgi:predicted AAA+ superfamily ATPase
MAGIDHLLDRADSLLRRLEDLLGDERPRDPDWAGFRAFRWRHTPRGGRVEPVSRPHGIALDDLLCMDVQKAEMVRNARQFVESRPANHVLLWGSRGTGKSSLIKAVLNAFAQRGLRLIELEKPGITDLPYIIDLVAARPEKFMLFCDDLSFEADDPSYKSLKAVLDGSVAAPPDNLILCATSNRRHLMPEYRWENLEARSIDGEIQHGESIEEKVSVSDRFGLWLSFYPFSQAQYLEIVDHWLDRLGASPRDGDAAHRAALQWALKRGSRSGRTAWQFARDWAGRGAP